MKRFVGIFACVTIGLFVFYFCGGWIFFDIQKHLYPWILGTALIASVIIWALLRLSDRIDALQKRVDALEAAQKGSDPTE